MKKARLLLTAVSSLLLSACEVPALEDFVGWREKFFLSITPEQVEQFLSPAVWILAAAATIGCYIGLARDRKRGTLWGAEFITSFTLLVSLILIYLVIYVDTLIGRNVLPQDLTLDRVVEAMRWGPTLDYKKIVTALWGLIFTLLVPVVNSLWQIVMLFLTIFALAWSIIGRSIKGLAFIAAMLIGRALFLVLFNAVVQFFGSHYPDWGNGDVAIAVNALYTGLILIAWVSLNIVLPILAAILAPELTDHVVPQPVLSAAVPVSNSPSGMFVPFPFPYQTPPASGGSRPNDGWYTSSGWNEDPVYQRGPVQRKLETGYPQLPPPTTPIAGGDDDPPDPPSPAPEGRRPEPRVPFGPTGPGTPESNVSPEGAHPHVPENRITHGISCDICGGENLSTDVACRHCGTLLDKEWTESEENSKPRSSSQERQARAAAKTATSAVVPESKPKGLKEPITSGESADTHAVDRTEDGKASRKEVSQPTAGSTHADQTLKPPPKKAPKKTRGSGPLVP